MWMTWMQQNQQDRQKQRKEDEASQSPKDAKSHVDEGQYQPGDSWCNPGYDKCQNQGSHHNNDQWAGQLFP